MVKSEPERQRFLQTLPKMKVFWGGLLSLGMGLGVGALFFLRVLNASPAGVLIGVIWATLVTVSIIVYMCYQFYSGKFAIPRDVVEAGLIVSREIIVVTPLLVGTIVIFYFLATDRLSYITPAVVASFVLWLLLRLLLRKKKRRTP